MTQGKNSQIFSDLQQSYTTWLARIVMSLFYGDRTQRDDTSCPDLLPEESPDLVRQNQMTLHEMAKELLRQEGLPSHDDMGSFLELFERVQLDLQRLEKGQIFADFGVDELTGFCCGDVILTELERELERRSRRGLPFSFALSRIDGPEDVRTNPVNIKLAAKHIRKTIRTFDDAYVMGAGEFLSHLKHADGDGGLRYVARLTDLLKSDPDVTFTMSSLVAEPVPGDNLKQLVDNVFRDLIKLSAEGQGKSEQYEEVSPLNRFIQSLKEKA